jgi:hypothetical protein
MNTILRIHDDRVLVVETIGMGEGGLVWLLTATSKYSGHRTKYCM